MSETAEGPNVLSAAIDSLVACLSFDPRDWGAERRDAWLYGILVGWGDALPEVAARHGWSSVDVMRLTRYHTAIVAASPYTPRTPARPTA